MKWWRKNKSKHKPLKTVNTSENQPVIEKKDKEMEMKWREKERSGDE